MSTWGPMSANPYSQISHGVTEALFPDDPPGFYKVPFSYSDPEAVVSDLGIAGFQAVTVAAISVERVVNDWETFARGIVFGNPLCIEIENRGGDATSVMNKTRDAFVAMWGEAPTSMPLQITIFHARTGA